MSSANSDNKDKAIYRVPTPIIIKSGTPITITDGKFTIVHSGNIIFHGNYAEFELQETQKTLIETSELSRAVQAHTQANLPSSFNIPEGYKFLTVSDAKTTGWGTKRSKYEAYKRDKDLSYMTIVRRNGDVRPPIRLGSLLDPESMISVALREFSKTPSFLRNEIKYQNMPASLAQGQRIKACLDILEKEGFFVKTEIKVGKTRTMDKYVRTEKKGYNEHPESGPEKTL